MSMLKPAGAQPGKPGPSQASVELRTLSSGQSWPGPCPHGVRRVVGRVDDVNGSLSRATNAGGTRCTAGWPLVGRCAKKIVSHRSRGPEAIERVDQ